MKLWTDAIDEHQYLDPRYTCDVDNSSPELRWEEAPPEGVAGYALLAEDLDAPGGVFCHWVVYNIPADLMHLPAGIPPQDALPNGIRQGLNDFGKLGYAGPCPPTHSTAHRYQYRLFALSEMPELPNRAKRDQLLSAIEGKVLAESRVECIYSRQLDRAG